MLFQSYFSHIALLFLSLPDIRSRKVKMQCVKLFLKRLYFTGLICHRVFSLWQHGSLGVKYVLGYSGDAQTAYDQLTQELKHTYSHTQFAHPCSVAWMVYEPHICQCVTGWQLKLPALCPLSSCQENTHKNIHAQTHMVTWNDDIKTGRSGSSWCFDQLLTAYVVFVWKSII